MIDFSQYSFGETSKDEKFNFSDKKAKNALILAFGLLLLVLVELSIFLFITHFPKGGYWLFLILNLAAAVFSIVMLFVCINLGTRAKQTNGNISYTHAGKPLFLLNALLYLTVAVVFLGRIINPDFLAVL